MLITMLAAGSRGDTEPYVALGVALKKAGHRVRIATFQHFAGFVQSYGLEHAPVRGDISQVVASEGIQGARYSDNPLKLILSFNTLRTLAIDLNEDFYQACQGADAIVYHPGPAVGYFLAQQMHIPAILATPFPMTPTREFPSLIFYNSIRLGSGFNLLSHKIFEQVMWFVSRGAIARFWKKQFGGIPNNFGCPYGRQTTRRNPTIVSCSQYVFPRPADWPAHITSAGYWFLEENPGWQPPDDYLKFLQKGEPPVYVGFGSIGDPSVAAQTTQLVIEALHRSGQRGLLATGWKGMAQPENLPEHVFILESAPHSWLFPRMAAVVHHGGAGTTAAGFRAGVPSVIIPHGNDQFAWARRAYELGVAARPIPRKSLNAENLAEAIRFALSNEVKLAASALGNNIRRENGAEAAAQVIIDSFNEASPN